MLVRILSNKIDIYEDVINEAIDKTIPKCQAQARTKLFEELLLGTAQLWVSEANNHFEGVFITKIIDDNACGGRTCVLVSGYAPGGLLNGAASVLAGWSDLSKFAKSQDCDRISFFTDNPEVEKYMHMFDKIWVTRYYQISLDKEV